MPRKKKWVAPTLHWSVIVELDATEDDIGGIKLAVQDALEASTGQRPRTTTITTSALNAALRRPERFQTATSSFPPPPPRIER